MEQPKVLVACPTYEGKDYCVDEWISHIKDLKYTNYNILLVDNTADNGDHAKWLTDTYGIEVIHHYRKDTALNQMMAECNEIIRKRVIDKGYDYLMSIESDVFPPKNIIPYLINKKLDVISGMYRIGFGKWKFPLLQITEPTSKIHEETGMIEGKVRQLWWDELLNFVDGEIKQIHACGIGCTLIKRRILDIIEFRTEETSSAHADSYFYMDLWNKNIPVFVDTSILCKHENEDWGKTWEKRNVDFDTKFIFEVNKDDQSLKIIKDKGSEKK
tara:strand:+ start:205 stop:1020 length:816 start_codon:yes stop_codon:yes gene_type:complete